MAGANSCWARMAVTEFESILCVMGSPRRVESREWHDVNYILQGSLWLLCGASFVKWLQRKQANLLGGQSSHPVQGGGLHHQGKSPVPP